MVKDTNNMFHPIKSQVRGLCVDGDMVILFLCIRFQKSPFFGTIHILLIVLILNDDVIFNFFQFIIYRWTLS